LKLARQMPSDPIKRVHVFMVHFPMQVNTSASCDLLQTV
jgi:hypothetical protein